jgi:SOS-response transcriptional repressor LexA
MTGAGIESGDILLVEKAREVQSGKVALVQLNGNELYAMAFKAMADAAQ